MLTRDLDGSQFLPLCAILILMPPRSAPSKTFRLQDRDLRILRGFLEARVMTRKHAAALFFSGRVHAARKRLQKLKAAGLLAERPRRIVEQAVLYPSKAAFRLLDSLGFLSEYPTLSISGHEKRVRVSDLTIRHELEVMDVKASVYVACAKHSGIAVTEFSTWPQRLQFDCSPFGAPLTVKPDGFFRIHQATEERQSTRSFYLELDRSTESHAKLLLRATCYLAYLRSGGFAARYGARRSDFRDHQFRVLFVLKSAERRNNIAESLLNNKPPILTHIWLATLADVARDPLGLIWIRPVDYRDALATTPHALHRRRISARYRRNRERDALVEQRAIKRALLTSEAAAIISQGAATTVGRRRSYRQQ